MKGMGPIASLLLSIIFFTGCGLSEGTIGQFAVSEDNRVIVFRERGFGDQILICDGKTIRPVATGLDFWIGRDGGFVVVLPLNYQELPGRGPWLIYRVSDGQKWTGEVRASDGAQAGPSNLPDSNSKDRETDVYIADGPVVTVGIGMMKIREDPAIGEITRDQFIKWRPGVGFRTASAATGQAMIRGKWESEWPGRLCPVVELSPDASNPRRTVWVTNGGNIVELCRQNDLPVSSALAVVTIPIGFFIPYWAQAVDRLPRALDPDPPSEREKQQARLKRLIEFEKNRSSGTLRGPSTRPGAEP